MTVHKITVELHLDGVAAEDLPLIDKCMAVVINQRLGALVLHDPVVVAIAVYPSNDQSERETPVDVYQSYLPWNEPPYPCPEAFSYADRVMAKDV